MNSDVDDEYPMTVWLDADACPIPIKEILFRAVQRCQVRLVVVANSLLRIPSSEYISFQLVPGGVDASDDYIADHCDVDDLVITGDIPLAARIVERGAIGLNPRGKIYTENNIGTILATRNLMDELRSTGKVSGGPKPHKKTDTQRFANSLNLIL